MPDASPALPPRRSRFWLFAPFAVLALAAAVWTATWFMIRAQTARALDDWITAEANLGRQWSCPGRTIGGFPFRIEVNCDSLGLQRPGAQLTLGPIAAVAQVYRPRHVIVQIAGPLRATEGERSVEGTWRLLEASVRTTETGLQRASVVAEDTALRLAGLAPGELRLGARRIETHLRPNPARTTEGAYDWSLDAKGLAVPGLDMLVGGGEPADLAADLTVSQARDRAARPLADELERWRQAGGRVEIARLALAKGPRRIEGRGQFALDEAHRPEGRADLAAAGVEGLLGTMIGGRSSAAAALLGALTGRPAEARAPAPEGAAGAGLKPLPPLRIEGGRVLLGALPIPGVRVAPLY